MLARTLLWLGAITFALATSAHAAMTISSHKTKDENCSAGICIPTGPNPNIRVNDLQKMLAHGDVKIVTGQGSTSIGVLDPLTWASTHRLTLDANQSIHIRAPIVVEGTGGVTLITNDGGTGGDYDFNTMTSGSITFWDTSSSLNINSADFTLVKDIKTLAADIAANLTGKYALANNYDAAADGVYSYAPIGTFSGTLEGLGNAIQNLSIATSLQNAQLGLVFDLQAGGTIRDIDLTQVSVSGGGSEHNCRCAAAGTLVDHSDGIITRVNVSGSVSEGPGSVYMGGIVASSSGTITASSFTGKLYNNRKNFQWIVMGGIAGYSSGNISQSSAVVDASGGGTAGGLVGESNGTVALSHTSGTVSAAFAGGLVGLVSGGTITQSFSNADVVSREYGGGLVGYGYDQTQIKQSYSTGAISGEGSGLGGGKLGGFIGLNEGVISQAYATGMISVIDRFCTGGFIGDYPNADNLYSSAYWNKTTSQQHRGACLGNIDSIIGLTDRQLKSALPAGFDPNVWGQNPNINNGWPYLLANPPPQ